MCLVLVVFVSVEVGDWYLLLLFYIMWKWIGVFCVLEVVVLKWVCFFEMYVLLMLFVDWLLIGLFDVLI